MADALALARSYVSSGVDLALCTPHYSRRYATDHGEARKQRAALTEALESEGIELALALAAEVSPEFSVSAPAEELLARSIAGRYLLVELVADTPVVFPDTVAARLAEFDLIPIFAHPERCRAIRRHVSALDEARSGGALVQVVAPSLIGGWGPEIAAMAWQLVDSGRADLIASDTHHLARRLSLLEAAELISDRLGDHVSWLLTTQRPGLVVRGLDPNREAEAR